VRSVLEPEIRLEKSNIKIDRKRRRKGKGVSRRERV
jgi:translation initiation factor 1 (eIF-1/SUI1)